jgi:hypothetical protein
MDYSKAVEFSIAQQLLVSQIKLVDAEINDWITQMNNLLMNSVTNLNENIIPTPQTNGDVICSLLKEKQIEGYEKYIESWNKIVEDRNNIYQNLNTLNNKIYTWATSSEG